MIKIDKLMCIGGLCEGLDFCTIFDKRIKGPVDTLAARNFESTLDIFNGKLFNNLLNDNITKQVYNSYKNPFTPED